MTEQTVRPAEMVGVTQLTWSREDYGHNFAVHWSYTLSNKAEKAIIRAVIAVRFLDKEQSEMHTQVQNLDLTDFLPRTTSRIAGTRQFTRLELRLEQVALLRVECLGAEMAT